MLCFIRSCNSQSGVRSLLVEVSPFNRDLTTYAYTCQGRSNSEGPAAIGFLKSELSSILGRIRCRIKNFPALFLRDVSLLMHRLCTGSDRSTHCYCSWKAVVYPIFVTSAHRGATPSEALPDPHFLDVCCPLCTASKTLSFL